jgi:hypothetical protein
MQQPPFSPTPGQGLPQPGYPSYSVQPNGDYSSPLSQPKLTRKIARKYGLTFGAIMAAIALLRYALGLILLSLVQQFHLLSISIFNIYSPLQTVIFTLIYWGVYFCAGIFAARKAQQIEAASFVCLWASLCYFGTCCLLEVISFLSVLSILIRIESSRSVFLTGLATSFAIIFCIQIGLGYGIGVLGGLVGKKLARKGVLPGAFPGTFS